MAEVRSRQGWYTSLERLKTKLEKLDSNTVTSGDLKAHLENADAIWKKLEDAHSKILANTQDDEGFLLQQKTLEPMSDLYFDIKSKLYTLQISRKPTPYQNPTNLRLPDIQIPPFDGKYADWPAFNDLFCASVDRHSCLTGAQKLVHLKSALRGEAAALIKSFIVTDENYQEAWSLLETRYNNTREIMTTLVRELMFQPSMKQESASELQQMLNTTLENLRSLKVLGRPTDQWDDLIVVLITEKFDSNTKAEWARSLKGTDPPTFQEVQDFILQHIRTLDARGQTKSTFPGSHKRPSFPQPGNGKKIASHHTTFSNCLHCKEPHQLYQCKQLIDMTPEVRVATVKNPPQRSRFGVNNTTISDSSESHAGSSSGGPPQRRQINNLTFSSSAPTLLKTAIVDVLDNYNVKHQLRVCLDDGGEGGLINEKLVHRMGLHKERTNVTISGVGEVEAMKANWKSNIRLFSKVNNSFIDVTLYAVPKVTGKINKLPAGSTHRWNHLIGLELADPEFYNGGEVDILLGADVVPYILREGLIQVNTESPVAQNTMFGWVVFGKAASVQPAMNTTTITRIHNYKCEISQALQRFWEIEEVPSHQSFSAEETACENHFAATYQRSANGRYSVRLPFKITKEKLGDSRDQAFRRLFSLERRFRKHPEYKEAYIKFMREYESLGHMSPVGSSENKQLTAYYLPHHFVLKEDSTTTKQRTVFDGSAKTTTGVSLNDVLMVGATVQSDLYTLIIKFRFYEVALKADVAKMYRQFEVHEEDRDFQRILWREQPTDQIKEYQLNTVTYGTASAPFLATRALNQLAQDERLQYPAAAQTILTSFYIDDCLKSCETVPEAKQLVAELISIIQRGGMEIRKWCSNNSAVINSIPEELREEGSETVFDNESDTSFKALGIKWKPSSDEFLFSVSVDQCAKPTKRYLLSEISKTFDPLGWLSPVTVRAKLLLQKVWLAGKDWDEEVPAVLQEEWTSYQEDIKLLEKVRIPRCIMRAAPISVELHGFCDSSELAYSSAVYLKSTYRDGSILVQLITSRTRVAPIKCISLPKLELCGATLLAETISVVTKTVPVEHTTYCWTDSTIVLRWIRSHSRKWKTFVSNRVSTIQQLVPPEQWHHVKGEENPADLPSRGISTEQLLTSSLWWNGAPWLQRSNYPVTEQTCDEEEVKKEERSKQLLCFHSTFGSAHDLWFNAYSNLSTLIRRTAVMTRVFMAMKLKTDIRSVMSTAELRSARVKLILWSQKVSFPEDINHLVKHNRVSSTSKLLSLNPFIDKEGLLRVGGRLQNADIPGDNKHQIILGHSHKLAELIIRSTHLKTLHGGFTLTFSTLSQEYWISHGRDTTRHLIRACVTCRRTNARAAEQLMGSLPAGRVNPSRPFLHCGVDFAGPFSVKTRKGRHVPVEKSYMCIYVCLSTKAVHLEAVTNLSSEAFIACYQRFASRRGISAQLYSDCGTNFVGADKILQQWLEADGEKLQSLIADLGTQWNFNPPAAPHQGGLWEAGVKSVKYHLTRIVGQQTLTSEQFSTLLCRIEACLNSRPLCALSSEPGDLDALTPAHFLIGGPLLSIPEPDCSMIQQNRLSYWETIRQMTQHFWKRWTVEYLSTLQQRHKWNQKRDNLIVGDLVVVGEENLAVSRWRLGRILQVHPGKDGLVRSATVKTALGELRRPITKLSPLLSIQNQ